MKKRHPLEWIIWLRRESAIETLDFQMREFLRREQKLKGFRGFFEYVMWLARQDYVKQLRERGEGLEAERLQVALHKRSLGAEERYYELENVAWVLGISRRAIARIVKRGELKVDAVFPDIVSESEVERYLQARPRMEWQIAL